MNKVISYGRQFVDQDDIDAVVEVLKSDFLTQGPRVREFEQSLSDYCGARYAVAFSSGTAALHGAYFAAGLGGGDELITSPITFIATANAAVYLGARPVFVDIEPDTGNIDAETIASAISPKTRAIVPIHYSGHPAEMARISQIARKHKLIVIEDACHALGATYHGSTTGDCKFSDMAVFSFHPVKSITTGEGGAVLTNRQDFREKLLMFRQHGVTKDKKTFRGENHAAGEWYYEMQHLGFNYRLTDIHCALGISQLKKLDGFIEKRRQIVKRYHDAFRDNPFFDLPEEREGIRSAWHLYPIRLKDKTKRPVVFSKLRQRKLWVQVHYIPVHLQPYYRDRFGCRAGDFPLAEDFYQRQISIPIFPAMTDEEISYTIRNLLEVFEES